MCVYKICVFVFLSAMLCVSCVRLAGNRQLDLNYKVYVSVNTFFVQKYLESNFMKEIYESPLNSELVNYPHDFIPITDTLRGFKYVIEMRVPGDSLQNEGWGLHLNSMYDFKKQDWITERDLVKPKDLELFKTFLRDSILQKTVNYYKGTIPDSILYVGKPPYSINIKAME
jgi:hypothetical protein